MPDDEQQKKSPSQFPHDHVLFCSLFFNIFVALFVTCYLPRAKTNGDTTLFNLALFLGAIGAGLLLIARIPLYRQRRFFTLGPKSLSGVYRKLYFAAYAFIIPSLLLLVLLLLAFR